MVIRLGAFVLLIWSAVSFPWWVTAIFTLIFVFYFKSFYEAVVGGVVFDILYDLPKDGFFFDRYFVVTTGVLILVFLVGKLKERIRY